jgi:hypothetical protein
MDTLLRVEGKQFEPHLCATDVHARLGINCWKQEFFLVMGGKILCQYASKHTQTGKDMLRSLLRKKVASIPCSVIKHLHGQHLFFTHTVPSNPDHVRGGVALKPVTLTEIQAVCSDVSGRVHKLRPI